MHWIDCSTREHKILSVTRTSHIDIQDMCIVEQDGKQILVTSSSFAGLNAYDVTSGVVSWSVIGRPPGMAEELCSVGVTTDKRGHLFVCDSSNKCIHIFATNGNYMGPILKNHPLGTPQLVRWHEQKSLLIVATIIQSNFHIGLIKLMLSNNDASQAPAWKDKVVRAKNPVHIKCKGKHLGWVAHQSAGLPILLAILVDSLEIRYFININLKAMLEYEQIPLDTVSACMAIKRLFPRSPHPVHIADVCPLRFIYAERKRIFCLIFITAQCKQ